MATFSIQFNIDTLEKIVFSPQEILDDYETFWNTARPMVLTQGWANSVHKEIDFSEWKAKLAEWAGLSEADRSHHAIYSTAKSIINAKDHFMQRAIPHLESFLPPDAELHVPIDFTAFIPCNAFAWRDVVINVADPYWNFNATRILNIIMHEVFHGGHSWYRQYYPQGSYGSEILFTILRNLQGEGICNYVSYTGQKIYPVPEERDYMMLENLDEVKAALRRINLLFAEYQTKPEEEIRTLSWNLGVKERAFYVLGSFMWKTIDEKLGRAALIRILSVDFTTFIHVYNNLVEPFMQIALPPIHFTPSETPSPVVSLRPITLENLNAILDLDVKPEQRGMVAPNARSIAQAHYYENVFLKGIYADETPVGFLMAAEPGRFNNPTPRYFLWRFMIDQKYQGHGYGKEALDLLCYHLRSYPDAEYLYGSYHPGDHGPGEFYKKYGFVDIEEFFGDEQMMRLKVSH